MSTILSQAEMLAMSAPDLKTFMKVGGGLLTIATAGFSAVKAFHQIPEKHVGIRTWNGKAVDENGERLHDLLRPGGHWMLPLIHNVALVNLQPEVTSIATTFDIVTTSGEVQYNLEATAIWRVLVDPDDDPNEAFTNAYNYYYGLNENSDVALRVGSRVESYMIECASSLPDDNRTFLALAELATRRLEETGDLYEYGIGVTEIELNAFYRAGVIQFGGTQQAPIL
jgi:regulator of protease activity HflC (stomatin/prohibitin superfamily)